MMQWIFHAIIYILKNLPKEQERDDIMNEGLELMGIDIRV